MNNLYNWFINLNYIYQSLIAGLFTYFITLLGSSIVYFFKKVNKLSMDIMLSISAGVMLSASFFSLLLPAINSDSTKNIPIIVSLGFLAGSLFLYLTDKIFNKLLSQKKKRISLLITSITIHNIPEGLALGISFASCYYSLTKEPILSSLILTLGIAIQNFPEGSAISLPLLREGMSKNKAFFLGQLSAIVEPISAVLGAFLILKIKNIFPFFLSFAAGSMIYVIVSELVPESQTNENKSLISLTTILGFILMMLLDLSF